MQRAARQAEWLIWTATGFAVVILLVFATIRLTEMSQGVPPDDAFGIRYNEHPVVALLHMLPGLVFLTLAPLQFVARIRRTRLGFHRRLGRVLVVAAVISGAFGIAAAFRLPAFGGIPTVAATVFFGVIFFVALGKAVWHIRRKQVRQHREWMIRVFALATAVAGIRVVIGLFAALSGYTLEEIFGTAFWIGFSTHLLAAEIWINQTRG